MSDLLQKIVFVLIPLFTSWVFSDILEQQDWFHKLSSQTKSQLWIIVSALIGFITYMLISNAAPETITQLTTGLAIITQIVTAYLGGQFYHQHLDDVTTTSTVLKSDDLTKPLSP